MAPKILMLNKLSWAQKECQELLGEIAEVVSVKSQSREELFKDFQEGGRYGDIVGIFHASDGFGRSDKEFFEALPTTCKIFAHKGAGYDSVDVHAAKARGVLVSNTPGAVDEATATTAVFLLIATVRKFSECEAIVRSGGFSVPPTIQSGAHDLSDRTVGVLGLGGIGLHIVNYIRPFGMPIFYHNRKPSLEAPSGITYCPDLYDMLGRIDILMVSIPLNASTRGFIGEKEIRAMKKGSIIVNTARGPIIDEEAMIKALQDGHLASVGLDVFTKEPLVDKRLIEMPQVTLLPHMGTENQDSRRKMEVVALNNLRDYITTGKGRTVVAECR